MVTTPLLRQQGTEALNVCLEAVAGQCGPMSLQAEGSLATWEGSQDLWPLPCEGLAPRHSPQARPASTSRRRR
jgi:hypothetical protein